MTESVYGPAWLWRRLGEIAAQDGRSKSDLVTAILEEWLEEHEGKRRR